MRIPIRRSSALARIPCRIPRRIPAHPCWTLPALILCAFVTLAAPAAFAAVSAAHPQPHRRHAPHIRRVAEKKPAAPIPPPPPPPPNWPVNSQPGPANVTWDSRGLTVVAANSSLADILHQVSIATGVHVEGFSADQRIFGDYGPGPAREVLSELLSGSGYNVLILGGRSSTPPTRIVLSPRPTGPAPPQPPVQQSDEDNGYPADSEPQPPLDGNAPGYQPAPPVRTPQQIMEEMQRRQQMMQQQQKQQQANPDSPDDQP